VNLSCKNSQVSDLDESNMDFKNDTTVKSMVSKSKKIIESNLLLDSKILSSIDSVVSLYSHIERKIYLIDLRTNSIIPDETAPSINGYLYFYEKLDSGMIYTDGFVSNFTTHIVHDGDTLDYEQWIVTSILDERVVFAEFEPINENSNLYLLDLETNISDKLGCVGNSVSFLNTDTLVVSRALEGKFEMFLYPLNNSRRVGGSNTVLLSESSPITILDILDNSIYYEMDNRVFVLEADKPRELEFSVNCYISEDYILSIKDSSLFYWERE
jgi:hypothetical protein